jgi:hypothetical protein
VFLLSEWVAQRFGSVLLFGRSVRSGFSSQTEPNSNLTSTESGLTDQLFGDILKEGPIGPIEKKMCSDC